MGGAGKVLGKSTEYVLALILFEQVHLLLLLWSFMDNIFICFSIKIRTQYWRLS